MKINLPLVAFMALSLVGANTASFAANADEGLYDPVAPKGSAFVRLYNGSAESVDFATNGKKHDSVTASTLSPYFVEKKGDVDATAAKLSVKEKAEEGAYYTVINQDGKLTVTKDAALGNRAKALVVFYNLTKTADLSLKTADGKVEVIGAQKSGASSAREMNGVKVSFGVFAGTASKASLNDVVLERGKAYAAIATEGKDGAVTVSWSESSTNTKK